MYINKSTARILQFFAGHITQSFSLREAARMLGMHVSLAHRAMQPLISSGIIMRDRHRHLALNYKSHHGIIAFAEYLRRDDFLARFRDMRLFADEVTSKIRQDCFALLVFGSAVDSARPRDIDILLIVDSAEKIVFHEKFLHNIASGYGIRFEERVFSSESVYEMLSRRDEKNLINEVLNRHIILYGAELFYRLLQRGRQ